MQDMERQNFEESLKRAFGRAEVSPSEDVWTNIELGLEKAQGKRLRRKVLIYQALAAASLFFAVGTSVSVYFNNTKLQSETTAKVAVNPPATVQKKDEPTVSEPTLSRENSDKVPVENHHTAASETTEPATTSLTSTAKNFLPSKLKSIEQQGLNSTASPDIEQPPLINDIHIKREALVSIENEKLPALSEIGKITLKLEKPEQPADPVALMLARLDDRERAIQKEEENNKKNKSRSETLWTSVGFAAGSFSPINAGVSSSQQPQQALSQLNSAQAINSSIANQQAKASGVTYSMGVNVGTRLSERWIVQGGVNYLTQSSDYTAHYGVFDQNFTKFRPSSGINELQKTAADDSPQGDKIAATAPYNVNNNNRYLSIPMQAGYLLINKGFGWQLNAGVATDLFLQNTLTADVQNPGQTTPGTDHNTNENSAYRSVNLSGLMGTEVSYKFGRHYRVALNPGLRYPFGNIYKSSSVKANPLTFDVGLRFRYIFH
jgi:hypothetical protein